MPPLTWRYLSKVSWVCEVPDAEVRIHHAVCRRGSCVVHAKVDSVEAFGKVITYPTKVDEYLILKHLHEKLSPPAAVPKPLCRAVGEYRGVLSERVSGETLDTLWARGYGPPPELVGKTVRRLHKALEGIETPWCRTGGVSKKDVEEWGMRPCLRAGLAAALAVITRDWIVLEAAEAVLLNCKRIRDMALDSLSERKQCIHGDLHLGQIVWAGGILYFTDFGGEPLKWPAPPGLPEPPARDMATLITSVNYLAQLWGKKKEWVRQTVVQLLSGYDLNLGLDNLRFWIVERATYELVYEKVAGTGLQRIPAELLRKSLIDNDWLI